MTLMGFMNSFIPENFVSKLPHIVEFFHYVREAFKNYLQKTYGIFHM